MIRILNLLFDAFAAAQKKRAEAAMERHEYVVQRNLELVRGNLVRIEDADLGAQPQHDRAQPAVRARLRAADQALDA